MITFAAPGFLLAGALLALVPLALHMLARTPPERRPLPTARFLTVDRRTQLRIRRPRDLLLMALRMLFIVLLGAAFAGPEWLPERAGTRIVVLLDTGAGMAPVWDEAVATARDRLRAGGAGGASGARGALVVFDSTARVLPDPEAALDSLRAAGPGAGASSYLAGLRGLKMAARTLLAESATAVLVTRPRWGSWSPGVPAAREAAWPAGIEVVALGGPAVPSSDRTPEQTGGGAPSTATAGADTVGADAAGAVPAALVGAEDHPLRPYATAALRSLGYAPGSDPAPALAVVLSPADSAARPIIPEAPNVVLLGGLPGAGGDSAVSTPSTAPRQAFGETRPRATEGPPVAGRLVWAGGRAMDGWVPRGRAVAASGEVVAVWEDGRPAAVAVHEGESCQSTLAAEPATPAAAADPSFPWLLRALATACDSAAMAGAGIARAGAPEPRAEATTRDDAPLTELPLDRGALTILRGDALPATLDLLAAEGPRRRSLAGPLLALALLVAFAEAALAYGRRRVG